MHNIRYGCVEATDEEVVEAAKVAHIHDSISNKFKKGYKTKVGEHPIQLRMEC
jgi:ABC-type multidrug transport system fused ATPase/permease subunit